MRHIEENQIPNNADELTNDDAKFRALLAETITDPASPLFGMPVVVAEGLHGR